MEDIRNVSLQMDTNVSPGEIVVPNQLRDHIQVVNVLVVPDVPHLLILGADFWRIMGIVPDLRTGEWTFSTSNFSSLDEVIISRSLLKTEQDQHLNNLINSMFDQITGNDIGCTTLVKHQISADGPPVKQRYYPVSPAMPRIVDKELDDMLSKNIVERSHSPWSSPILLVPKKDGTHRFCVDYRKLNKVTRRDTYPLPNISNTLDKLRDAKYLSSLNIKSTYGQIPVAKLSREFTAFTVPNRGLFQFKRMPYTTRL